MYGIDELLENYKRDEVADGALKALSKSVNLHIKKEKRGNEQTVQLSASFTGEKSGSRNAFVNTRVVVDEINGELQESSCDCQRFEKDGYACEHTVALQVDWLEKTLGRDALKSSEIKDILEKKTGLGDPFIPGILKETSYGIQRMIKRASEETFPMTASAVQGRIELELHLAEVGKLNFELKVGEKRSYVVKDAWDFLQAFDTHEDLQFGKNLSFPAYEEAFDKESRELLVYLRGLFKDARDDRQRNLFLSSYGNGNARYLHLTGMEFDMLMERCGKYGIYISDKKKVYFSADEYKPGLRLKKQEYGAVLEFDKFRELISTSEWCYLLQEDRIYRIPRDDKGTVDSILGLAADRGDLFISERDLSQICQTMLPELTPVMDVKGSGMELSDYLPAKPDFRLYLDYPQDDMISCHAVACYGEEEYPLGKEMKPEQKRNRAAEQEELMKLQPYFHAYEEATESFFYQGGEGEIYYFLTERLPELEALGEIFISDKLKKLQVRSMSGIKVGISIESGLLQLDMASEGFTRDELMEILSSFRSKKKFYRLKNGSFIKVDQEQEALWLALAECLKGYRKPKDAEWRIPLFRAMYLDEMLKDRDGVDYDKSREYRRLLGRMREALNSSYEPPQSLATVLRGYQTDGFCWLKTLKYNGFGGILADDMGLGKTLQILAFLLSEKEAGKTGDAMRTLIVTPASLLYNWKQEIEKYTPQLQVQVIAGAVTDRQQLLSGEALDKEIWITSYDLLKRDIQWYEGIVFANEIIDEAQYIKNQTTQVAKAVRLISSQFRMALTGTPIENRLSELWSIFDYLMPGFLYTYSRFREEIEAPVMNGADSDAMEKLRRMVHPFILRRLKKEVLKELPDKLEEEIAVSFGEEQKRLYDAHAQRLKMYLAKQTPEEFAQGKLEILAELTKLRQLCCGPELLMENYTGENAKLETCMELVSQAIEGGHKVLLFSQFTSMLDQIGARLTKDKIAFYRIDGSVSKEERMRRVDAFGQDDTPVFCISLKAGGTGLNLTAADIVIHYDPWWNLAAQNQATDRAHRIGQTHVVTVYQLIAAGTVEEKILNLQKSKYQLAEDVLSGEGISSILIDREQLMSLLD